MTTPRSSRPATTISFARCNRIGSCVVISGASASSDAASMLQIGGEHEPQQYQRDDGEDDQVALLVRFVFLVRDFLLEACRLLVSGEAGAADHLLAQRHEPVGLDELAAQLAADL